MGTVGLKWQIIGVGNFSSTAGETDMIMRNITTGGLEVYNIANNQITGAAFLGTVGLDWQRGGFAADPPTGSMGGSVVSPAQPLSSCRQWRALAAAAAQPTD